MTREEKFSFESIDTLTDTLHREDAVKTGISINAKQKLLVFSKKALEKRKWANKYIKLKADLSKNALGWSFMPDDYEDVEVLQSIRKISVNKAGIATVSIGKALKLMSLDEDIKTYVNLEVNTYIPTSVFDIDKSMIYYVQLPKKKIKYEKNETTL